MTPPAPRRSRFVDAVIRLEARLGLTTKLLLAVFVTLLVFIALAFAVGGDPTVVRRVVLRTLIEGVFFAGLASLVVRRTRRIAEVADTIDVEGDPPQPPVPLADARDELLQVEARVRDLGRRLLLGSRQQALITSLSSLMRPDGELEELFDFVVDQVADDLAVADVVVVTWDADRRRLSLRATTSAEAADHAIESLLGRPGLVEEALGASGAAQLVPDGQRSVLFAPLDDGSRPGLLVAVDRADRTFGSEDLDYVGGVARAISIAALHSAGRARMAQAQDLHADVLQRVPVVVYTRSVGVPTVHPVVSAKVEDLLGTPATQWKAQPGLWESLLHPDDRDRVLSAWQDAQHAGAPFDAEYRLRNRDGSWRWVHDAAAGSEADGVDPSHVQGLLVDISREREVEASLVAERTRMEAILRATPVVLASIGVDGRNEFVSEGVYAMTGRIAEDLVGRPATAFAHPDDVGDLVEGFEAVLAGRVPRWRGRYRYQHADGHWLMIEARGEPLREPGGEVTGVVFGLVDVTESADLQQELQRAKDEAETANVAKSDFLSRMSHELRTPMNAVLGFAQLLELEELTQDGDESVQQILRAGGHLLDLIDEVLDISRIEAGRMNVELEPVDLRGVVTEVLELLAPAAERRQVDLQVRGDLDGVVVADPQRFKQVVLNVVGNAIKYNRIGGQVVVASAPVQAGAAMIRLSVQDTGVGIPADRLERVFVPFDRLGAEQSGVEGTGLGLALSHRLIDVMGGVLGVESTVGSGSTFWIDLPRSEQPVVRRVLGEEVILVEGERRLAGQVLYVEDNLSNLRLVERLLGRHAEVDLLSAMQGTIGIQLARDHHPDVVLLDMNLPDMDGAQVLRTLAADARTADIPVIVVSADATVRQREHLLDLGAHAYLTKPIDVPRFLEVLADVLDRRVLRGRDGGGA